MPSLTTYAWVKYWNAPIAPVTRLNRIAGLIIGIVTWRSFAADPRAVDLGRVVQVARHALQGAEVDDDHVPDGPDRHQHEPGFRPRRVVEPLRAVDPDDTQGRR